MLGPDSPCSSRAPKWSHFLAANIFFKLSKKVFICFLKSRYWDMTEIQKAVHISDIQPDEFEDK